MQIGFRGFFGNVASSRRGDAAALVAPIRATQTETSRQKSGLLAHSSPPTASSHTRAAASDGIRQSPRGDTLTEPTFGPSGRHDRLNWLAKNRRRNTFSHF